MAKGRRPLTKSGMLNQFGGTAISTATGFAIGSVLAPTLAPITQGLLNETWHAIPNRPLSATTVAEAAARGYVDRDKAADEAQHTGYARSRFDLLDELAGDAPSTQQLLALRNRGVIDDDELLEGLQRSGMRPEWWQRFSRLRRYLPSVSDLITWGVREVFSPAQRAALDLDAEFPPELATRLAEQGYSELDARNSWAAHWQLPSRTEGAQMLYRKLITDDEYTELLRALDYAPTWREPLKAIADAIPGLSDMVRFAVREVYDPARRAALKLDEDYPPAFTPQARKHGLAEQDARDYWAAHWQLPSPTQMYRMLWRGLITIDELDAGLKAADYSPAWRSKLRDIAYLVPGRVDLRRMLAHKIITREDVRKGYMRLGYTAADAETLTKFAEELAAAPAVTTEKFIVKARGTLFTRVHTEYTGRQLTDAEAHAGLVAAGVPADEIDDVLELWRTEASLIRTELTQAQIVKANKKGLYSREEAIAELVERGMTEADATIRLDEG